MDLTEAQLFYRFGVALVVGFLIGLQREYAYRRKGESEGKREQEGELMAGARTFPIIALLGAVAALGGRELESALPVAGATLAVSILLAVSHYRQAHGRAMGLTTEIAALVSFFTGALCYWGFLPLAAALGVATAVLLSLKVQTHTLARQISSEDVYATLKFAVITVIVLPLLPQTGYGPAPFDVLVPYNVWLMVVLISGISFMGYVLIKVVGPRRGIGLTGVLGGVASSTAVTLSIAGRSRDTEGLDRPFALALLLAWTIMLARVIIEVAVVHPPLLRTVWIPVLGVFVVSLLYCGYLYYTQPAGEDRDPPTVKNPFRLGPAITFGALYAIILVASNGAQAYFGDAGIYLSSVVAGLADVDAITLSMARLHGAGQLAGPTATRAILIAAAANTLLKGGIVALAGTPRLRRAVAPGLLLIVGTALGAALLV
mgnify:CR=1 FL=1